MDKTLLYYKERYASSYFSELSAVLKSFNPGNEKSPYHYMKDLKGNDDYYPFRIYLRSDNTSYKYYTDEKSGKAFNYAANGYESDISDKDLMIAIDKFFSLVDGDKSLEKHVCALLKQAILPLGFNATHAQTAIANVVEQCIKKIAKDFNVNITSTPGKDPVINDYIVSIHNTLNPNGTFTNFYKNQLHALRVFRNIESHTLDVIFEPKNIHTTIKFLFHTLVGLCFHLIKIANPSAFDTSDINVVVSCEANALDERIKIIKVIEHNDEGCSSITVDPVESGDVENCFVLKLQRYHHYKIYNVADLKGESTDDEIWNDSDIPCFEICAEYTPGKACLDFYTCDNAIIKLTIPIGSCEFDKCANLIGEIINNVKKSKIEGYEKIINEINNLNSKINNNNNAEKSYELLTNVNALLTQLENSTQKGINGISEKLNKDISKQLQDIIGKLDGSDIKKSIAEINSGQLDIYALIADERKRRRRVMNTILAMFVFVIVGLPLFIFSEQIYDKTHIEMFASIAHMSGSDDVAYNHARWLEKNGEYGNATTWYSKAKERFADVVAADSTQTEYAYRLALMYFRLKGGSEQGIDYSLNKAIRYARVASYGERGIALYVFLNLLKGDAADVELRTMLNSLQGADAQKDKYVQLSNIIMQTAGREILAQDDSRERYLASFSTLDSLCYDSEVAPEAMLVASELQTGGVSTADGKGYKIEPDIYSALSTLNVLSFEMNDAKGQLNYAQLAIKLRLNSIAEQLLARLWSNGIKESAYFIVSLVDAGLITTPVYMNEVYQYLNSLDNDNIAKLVTSAKQNERKGYTGEKYVLDLYTKAFSLDSLDAGQRLTDAAYDNAMNSLLKLEKYNSVERLKEFFANNKMDVAMGCAEYLMGVKCANGYGCEVDLQASDSLLRMASDMGYMPASYSLGRRLMMDDASRIEGLRILNKISGSYTPAAAYLAVYYYCCIDQELAMQQAAKINEPEYDIYKAILSLCDIHQLKNEVEMLQYLEVVVSRNVNEIARLPHLYAVLYNAIAEAYMKQYPSMEIVDKVAFYSETALALGDAEMDAKMLFMLAEYYTLMGDKERALANYREFCNIFYRGFPVDKNMFDAVTERVALLCPEALLGYLSNDEIDRYATAAAVNTGNDFYWVITSEQSLIDSFPMYIY